MVHGREKILRSQKNLLVNLPNQGLTFLMSYVNSGNYCRCAGPNFLLGFLSCQSWSNFGSTPTPIHSMVVKDPTQGSHSVFFESCLDVCTTQHFPHLAISQNVSSVASLTQKWDSMQLAASPSCSTRRARGRLSSCILAETGGGPPVGRTKLASAPRSQGFLYYV